ncbi:MAG: heat-inducible transcriptional repressor [Actinomycetota bacterium]|jgi:heat-inducible transcriptional repressor|nr:heat-inducible transcriptional repressor [Actinomycetota bacterium]
MLDDRKAAILRAVVQEYIQSGQPVGSAHLARARNLGVSPATVRNEMAALERDGFLAHPHTSAGRIPTDKGYRFFVDNIGVPQGTLEPGQKQQVHTFFARAHGQLEEMLHDTSCLLSSLTHYAAMVVAPQHESATVRSVQVVGLGTRVALVVAVLSTGAIEKATLEIDGAVGDEQLAKASAHLNTHIIGHPISDDRALPTTGDVVVDRLVADARVGLVDHHSREAEQVYVDGASHMAATFEAVATVRQVLTILEQQYVVVSLLREALHDDRLNVVIGTEHRVESLAECSIIVAPYEVDGGRAGTIGVLGPTRMNYPQAMAAVAAVSQRLGRALSEG